MARRNADRLPAAWLCVALVLGSAGPGLADDPPADLAGDADRATGLQVARLLRRLRDEATAQWKQQRWDWAAVPAASTAGDGASADPTPAVPDDLLLRLLGRRQHANPAIDACVRWRLLKLRPDLDGATTEQLARILATRPALSAPDVSAPPHAARPAVRTSFATLPDATQRAGRRRAAGPGRVNPTLSVVSTGTMMTVTGGVNPQDPRYVAATVETGTARLDRLRRIAVLGNEAVLRFRDDLVAALPAERGVRLIASMQDAADRIAAAEPSHADAVRRAVADSADPRLRVTEALRRQLLDFARQLHDPGPAPARGDLPPARFPTPQLQTLIANIQAAASAEESPQP